MHDDERKAMNNEKTDVDDGISLCGGIDDWSSQLSNYSGILKEKKRKLGHTQGCTSIPRKNLIACRNSRLKGINYISSILTIVMY